MANENNRAFQKFLDKTQALLDEKAAKILELTTQVETMKRALKNPSAVFINMQRGIIAKPSFLDMLSLYGENPIANEVRQLQQELKDEQHKNAEALVRISKLERSSNSK